MVPFAYYELYLVLPNGPIGPKGTGAIPVPIFLLLTKFYMCSRLLVYCFIEKLPHNCCCRGKKNKKCYYFLILR